MNEDMVGTQKALAIPDDDVTMKVVYRASPSAATSHSAIRSEQLQLLQTQVVNAGKYEITDDTLLVLLSHAVLQSIEKNEHVPIPSWHDITSPFFSKAPADMQPVVYIKRLVMYLNCSRSAFVVALIYIQRIQLKYPQLALVERNMHRFLVTSILIAAKTLDDRVFSNSHYACVGGLGTVEELNRLELKMMSMLNFHFFVYQEEYTVFILQMSMRQIPSLGIRFKLRITRKYRMAYFLAKSRKYKEDRKEIDID